MYSTNSTSRRKIKSLLQTSRNACLSIFEAIAVAGEIGLILGELTMLRLLENRSETFPRPRIFLDTEL